MYDITSVHCSTIIMNLENEFRAPQNNTNVSVMNFYTKTENHGFILTKRGIHGKLHAAAYHSACLLGRDAVPVTHLYFDLVKTCQS